MYNEQAFILSCANDHLKVAQWLCTLYDKYSIDVIDDKIIKYEIKD